MEKVNNWIVTIIGALLVLSLIGPSLGFDQLGTLVSGGITSWLVALGVLFIGVTKLLNK